MTGQAKLLGVCACCWVAGQAAGRLFKLRQPVRCVALVLCVSLPYRQLHALPNCAGPAVACDRVLLLAAQGRLGGAQGGCWSTFAGP